MDNNKEEIRELRETIESLISRIKYLEKAVINDEITDKLLRLEHLVARMLCEPDEMRRLSKQFESEYGKVDWSRDHEGGWR